MTHWWQRWAVWWVESQKSQPMSHQDSLVVKVVVGWWCKHHAQMWVDMGMDVPWWWWWCCPVIVNI